MTTTITVTPLQVLPCQSYTFPSCSVCYAKVTVQSLSLTAVCSRCRAIHNSADVEPRYRLSMLVAHAESIQRVTAFGGSLSRLFGVDARTFAGSQDCADHKNATAALSHILVGSRLSITIPSRYVKRKQVFDPQKALKRCKLDQMLL
ncbi:hypothetical protein BC832DRAFT_404260 [Gaertneriomyces semiglobifer]|nr:hypothetical protein BC832DRAFT_404260 [Gaertneriomyces semiglobifer]